MSGACCGDDAGDGGDLEIEAAGPEGLRNVTELRAAGAAGILLAGAFAAGQVDASGLQLALEWVALLVGGATFVPQSLRRLLQRRIGVGTLMTIAAVGAVVLGEVAEAAALAFLFSISEGLEEYSFARTRRGLRALLNLVPDAATVLRGGREEVITPAELVPDDVMLVKPGERVATDGTIRAGRTALDVSAITGESVPVEAGPGDAVYAGSINGGGALEVVVTAAAADNSLARIVRIVEAEQARKGEAQRLADRIARPMVPGVMLVAGLIAGLGALLGDASTWVERALVVLVAASPCALAISVPVAVVAAVGAASRMGVLIKGGAAVEALGAIRGVALDKTGTLTRNAPEVVDVATSAGIARAEVLRVAAALEARSEHPLARAILAAVPDVTAASDVEAVPGAGLIGRLDGAGVRLGRPGWIEPGALGPEVQRMQRAGATAVLVERDNRVLGAVAVRDELRPEAAEVVTRLSRDGYTVTMLTGDNARTAAALAAEAGITEVHADLRPEDKAALITELRKHRRTAMVGDGVNDAPALATADLGIAMGAMGEDLRHLPRAFAHARRSRRIMLQNVALSLAIVIALMPLAFLGILGLAAVVLVHEIAEVVVIANGVRAGRAQPLAPRESTPSRPASALASTTR